MSTLPSTLPPAYRWLGGVGVLPRTIQEALKLYGTREIVGRGSQRTIISWRDELNAAAGVQGIAQPVLGFSDDDIPWCGLFAAIVAFRAGKKVVQSPLWARNWTKFGEATDAPCLGDVLVFARNTGGHVGFYVGEDPLYYHVLGGNQANRVSITRIAKSRLIGKRKPYYREAPASAKPYRLKPEGAVSANEA